MDLKSCFPGTFKLEEGQRKKAIVQNEAAEKSRLQEDDYNERIMPSLA